MHLLSTSLNIRSADNSVAERITSRESQDCRCYLKTNLSSPNGRTEKAKQIYKQWEIEYNRDIDEYRSGLSNKIQSRRSTLSYHRRNEEILEEFKVETVDEETKTLSSKLVTTCNKNEKQWVAKNNAEL